MKEEQGSSGGPWAHQIPEKTSGKGCGATAPQERREPGTTKGEEGNKT